MTADPLGKSPGQPSDLSSLGLSNGYTDIPDIAVDAIADRVQPRQVATGVTRGTWRISNIDGTYITIGVIPNTDGEFGIAFFDSSDNFIKKVTAATEFIYDPTTGKNVYQAGKLPDDTYGTAAANTGFDVEDGF